MSTKMLIAQPPVQPEVQFIESLAAFTSFPQLQAHIKAALPTLAEPLRTVMQQLATYTAKQLLSAAMVKGGCHLEYEAVRLIQGRSRMFRLHLNPHKPSDREFLQEFITFQAEQAKAKKE